MYNPDLFHYYFIVAAPVQSPRISTGSLPFNIKYYWHSAPPILLQHIFPYIIATYYPTLTPPAQPTYMPRGATYVSPNTRPTIVLSTNPTFDPSVIPIKDTTYNSIYQPRIPPPPDPRKFPSMFLTVPPRLELIYDSSSVPLFEPSNNPNSSLTSDTPLVPFFKHLFHMSLTDIHTL